MLEVRLATRLLGNRLGVQGDNLKQVMEAHFANQNSLSDIDKLSEMIKMVDQVLPQNVLTFEESAHELNLTVSFYDTTLKDGRV